MNDQLPVLKYRGYIGKLRINPKDNDRIYGSIAREDAPKKKIDGYGYAGDNVAEARERFKSCVDSCINAIEYKEKQRQFSQGCDTGFIASVINIMPGEFKRIVESGNYDRSLLEKVPCGDYEVPLYYVTKAWDFLLRGNMCGYEFMFGLWEEESVDDWRDYFTDEYNDYKPMPRLKCQAIGHNIEMKKLWKQYFDIDVDALEIDFSQFDKHMMPNVLDEDEYDYFNNVPYGLFEWVLFPLNDPDMEYVTWDFTSSLMESCAYIKRERERATGDW